MSTLNQRLYVNVDSTFVFQRLFKFQIQIYFQHYFNIYCQRRINIESTDSCPLSSTWKQMNHHYTREERNSVYNMLLELLPIHQNLLMKLHSHQIMLIYMNKNLKLLIHLSSEFHHS